MADIKCPILGCWRQYQSKVAKQLSFIAFLVIITSCDSKTASSDSTKDSNEATDIIGLWVNQDYINKLNRYSSISQANRETDFFIAILFTPDSNVEALRHDEIEPVIGRLNEGLINFSNATHAIKQITPDQIEITSDEKKVMFNRLIGKNYQNTFDGRDYLNSLVLVGTWTFVDALLNKGDTITLKPSNQLTGLAGINTYYPSSYLENDILLLGDDHEIKRSFILQKADSGFMLTEVENFEWNDKALKTTGRIYKLLR